MAADPEIGFTVDYVVLAANQALVAFTLGLGSGIWRKLRCRSIARAVCRVYPDADEIHITSVLHGISWTMPVSYVLFVILMQDNTTGRRIGTLFYQCAIIYLMYIVFKALDRRRPFLLEARRSKDSVDETLKIQTEEDGPC